MTNESNNNNNTSISNYAETAYESPRRRTMTSSYGHDGTGTPRNDYSSTNNWINQPSHTPVAQLHHQHQHQHQQQQHQQQQQSIVSLALALTPKTHNKRRRPVPTVPLPLPPQPPSLPCPSGTNTNTCTINRTNERDMYSNNNNNTNQNYNYFDCQSLQRSLKRVRLSSSPHRRMVAKSINDDDDDNDNDDCVGTPATTTTSTSDYYTMSSHHGTTNNSTSLSCNKRSPGEIRLQKDIQHAILHHSWKYVDRNQQYNTYRQFSINNSIFADGRMLDTDVHHRHVHHHPKQSNIYSLSNRQTYSDNPDHRPFDISSSSTKDECYYGNEQWTLPSLQYDTNTCKLRHRNNYTTSIYVDDSKYHKNDLQTNLYQHQEAHSSTQSSFVVNVQIYRKSNDPMNFVIQVHLRCENDISIEPTSLQSCFSPVQDLGNGISVVMTLQVPRLYPHQPPIVQPIKNSFTGSDLCTSEYSSFNVVGGPTSILVMPTIHIEPNPIELMSSEKYIDSSSSSTASSSLFPPTPSITSPAIVISKWTPLSRFADVIDMIVTDICKWYSPTLLLQMMECNNKYQRQDTIKIGSIGNTIIVNAEVLSSLSSPFVCCDEKKDEDELTPNKATTIKDIDTDIVIEQVVTAVVPSSSNDGNGSNLTPTMSNTTFRRLRQQQQSQHKSPPYGWHNTFVAASGTSTNHNNNNNSTVQLTNDNDNSNNNNNTNYGYRSPLRRQQKTNDDCSTSSDDSDVDITCSGCGDIGDDGGGTDSMDVAAATTTTNEIDDDDDDEDYQGSDDSHAMLTFDGCSMVLRYGHDKQTSLNNNNISFYEGRTNEISLANNARIIDVVLPVQETFPPNRFNVGYANTNTNDHNNNNNSAYCLRPARSLLGGKISSSLFQDDESSIMNINNNNNSHDHSTDDDDDDDDNVKYSPSNDFTLYSDDNDDDSTMDI